MSTALTPQSPLMHPVEYAGQTYFTSQYFHAQYLANSPHGGKLRLHKNFLQAIRNIPAYQDYIEQSHIVEITYDRNIHAGAEKFSPLFPLFKATSYNPIMLINAVFQAALSHHLDDVISKQLSVAINTAAAKKAYRATGLLPDEIAPKVLSGHIDAAQTLGIALHIAQQEAVKAVLAETGVDYRPLLALAPAQDAIRQDEEMLEPTDLAKVLGFSSGQAMNQALLALGWQSSRGGGLWEPTAVGNEYAARHAWTKGGKTGYNWKWNVQAVRSALQGL